jgi:arginyl-tRNA synthetase
MKQQIKESLKKKMEQLQDEGVWKDFSLPDFDVERPKSYSHGDYTVNLGFVLAKVLGQNPVETNTQIIQGLDIEGISTIDIVGGYINFHITADNRLDIIRRVNQLDECYGQNELYVGQKIMVEYTDPNPFKVFHIGHLMPNVIGESIATLLSFSGADVIRANYQGDIGRHVAMALWGMQQNTQGMPHESDTLKQKAVYLGTCYAEGSKAFESDEAAKARIIAINQAVYEGSDDVLNELYTKGRAWSLEKFEEIYLLLGTAFDEYFFESETWKEGKKLVEQHIPDVFEYSDGAVIFDGERHDLHKRVFINSAGLTTYEAKDLGLIFEKRSRHDCDRYIIVTAIEQGPYFQVIFKAIEEVEPAFTGKLENVAHGLLQLRSGKMSSRTGNVISGEDLLDDAREIASKKTNESKEISVDESLTDHIAVAGIKFSILKQAVEKNSIYDHEEALSFEGDSGPYIQYTHVRTVSVLQKSRSIDLDGAYIFEENMRELLYLLDLFPEIIQRATVERSPHYVANFLIDLSRAYNSYYAHTKIITEDDETQSRVALTRAVGIVLKNGLHVLGIAAPEKM